MREARQGAAGLSADGRPRPGRASRTSALVRPGVGQRSQHPVLGGRPGARAVGPSRVVGVLAVGDRVEPVRGDHLVADRVNSSSLQWKHRSGPFAW